MSEKQMIIGGLFLLAFAAIAVIGALIENVQDNIHEQFMAEKGYVKSDEFPYKFVPADPATGVPSND